MGKFGSDPVDFLWKYRKKKNYRTVLTAGFSEYLLDYKYIFWEKVSTFGIGCGISVLPKVRFSAKYRIPHILYSAVYAVHSANEFCPADQSIVAYVQGASALSTFLESNILYSYFNDSCPLTKTKLKKATF